jgi:hypothetical protein
MKDLQTLTIWEPFLHHEHISHIAFTTGESSGEERCVTAPTSPGKLYKYTKSKVDAIIRKSGSCFAIRSLSWITWFVAYHSAYWLRIKPALLWAIVT